VGSPAGGDHVSGGGDEYFRAGLGSSTVMGSKGLRGSSAAGHGRGVTVALIDPAGHILREWVAADFGAPADSYEVDGLVYDTTRYLRIGTPAGVRHEVYVTQRTS
jgi:hypothetical protein